MKFSEIKFGLYSLITASASLILYIYTNYRAYEHELEVYRQLIHTTGDVNANLSTGSVKQSFIFSSIALLFGILAFINKSKFKIPAIILSGSVFLLSFFPLWIYFV